MKLNPILMCPKHLENCHYRAAQDAYRCTANKIPTAMTVLLEKF